jgi:O-methyltransferase
MKKKIYKYLETLLIYFVSRFSEAKNKLIENHNKEYDPSRNVPFELENFKPFNYPKYPNIVHEKIKPVSTFSPWRSDREFMIMFEELKKYTYLDIYRLYELFYLAKSVSALKGDFLEVGVAKGGSGVMLARILKSMNVKKKIFLADTFAGVVNTSIKDTAYQDGMHSYKENEVINLLKKFECLNNSIILKGMFPKENYQHFDNKSLCFVHIDVDVYQSTKDVLEFVNNKVVKNGLIIIDDYGFAGCEGATQAVMDFIKVNQKQYAFIHNINGHAILLKL